MPTPIERQEVQGLLAAEQAQRPSARLRGAVERTLRQDLTSLPATISDGRLVGLLVRDDAEHALAAVKKT
jgi:hypothetical protein